MALDRLGQCLEENNCAPGSDKVIVLVSHHFGMSSLKHLLTMRSLESGTH